MNDQPQPAWEELFQKKIFPLTVYASAEPVRKAINEILATERVKWQEEARREIEDQLGDPEKCYCAGFTHRYCIENRQIHIILSLPFLTLPPQEETK